MFVLPFRIRVFATKTQNRNGLGAELFRRANDIAGQKRTPDRMAGPHCPDKRKRPDRLAVRLVRAKANARTDWRSGRPA
jgi:hypothetical protein